MMIEVLKQPVLNVQIEMLQRSLEAEHRERELVRQRNTIIYIGIAIINVTMTGKPSGWFFAPVSSRAFPVREMRSLKRR